MTETVEPGCRVDIVLVEQLEKETATHSVLKDILVLAIDPKAKKNLTVEVTPEEARRLALAGQLVEPRFSPQPKAGKK